MLGWLNCVFSPVWSIWFCLFQIHVNHCARCHSYNTGVQRLTTYLERTVCFHIFYWPWTRGRSYLSFRYTHHLSHAITDSIILSYAVIAVYLTTYSWYFKIYPPQDSSAPFLKILTLYFPFYAVGTVAFTFPIIFFHLHVHMTYWTYHSVALHHVTLNCITLQCINLHRWLSFYTYITCITLTIPTWSYMHPSMHVYIPTYPSTYIPKVLHTYIPPSTPTYLRAYILS